MCSVAFLSPLLQSAACCTVGNPIVERSLHCFATFYTPPLISVRFRTGYNDDGRSDDENGDEQHRAGIAPRKAFVRRGVSCEPELWSANDAVGRRGVAADCCRKLPNTSPTNISQIFHCPQTANIC